jgi:guanine nucleotide-binding protein G(i) subunit alpha
VIISLFSHTNSDCATGSGESGKSTIVKQMKIIHQNGYTVEELALYRLTIYKNLLDCVKSLIGAYEQFDLEPSSQKVRDFIVYLNEYSIDPDPNTPLNLKVGEAVTYLWNDPCTATVLEHQSEFYLMDSAP